MAVAFAVEVTAEVQQVSSAALACLHACATVAPLASSTCACLSLLIICSGVCRLLLISLPPYCVQVHPILT